MHPMRKGKDRKLSNFCKYIQLSTATFLASPRAFRTGQKKKLYEQIGGNHPWGSRTEVWSGSYLLDMGGS